MFVFVYSCTFVFVCIRTGAGLAWRDETSAEAMQKAGADYVWKSLRTCVSITSVWSVRESQNKTGHIGQMLF